MPRCLDLTLAGAVACLIAGCATHSTPTVTTSGSAREAVPRSPIGRDVRSPQAGNSLAPAFALRVNVGTSQFTAYLDPTTGRPDTQIENVIAIYQLVELATGKIVVSDVSGDGVVTFQRTLTDGSTMRARLPMARVVGMVAPKPAARQTF